MNNQQYLTVTALTKYIKRKFDADPYLQNITVKGEISNFKLHTSGHMYFTLKDNGARILAAMFSNYNRFLKFVPENGMQVIITGDVRVYEQAGQYQLYVKEMQPDGIGDLYLAFEQLKEKLEKEGLFSDKYKKPIPKYPETIGVITSPTGAAVRDVITTIRRRYPIAKIIVIPTLVQGDYAHSSIVQSIKRANEMEEIDCIILARGGGSIEELWAFNEEVVARAIFFSNIPIITGVGHETDFTIADFVADRRGPTPTGAAELAVPHIDELFDKIITRQTRLIRGMKKKLQLCHSQYSRLQNSYVFRYPWRYYEQKGEQLDRLNERLVRETRKLYEKKCESLVHIEKRFSLIRPHDLVNTSSKGHMILEKNLIRIMSNIYVTKQKDFRQLISTLEALSPLKVMERGYSLVYNESGELVKTVQAFHKNDRLKVEMSDGSIHCAVTDIDGKE